MNLVSKRKRKKEKATYHECSLCTGLHYKTRRTHGHLLDELKRVVSYDYDMKSSKWRHQRWMYTKITEPAYASAYKRLVDFERVMKGLSESAYARDQRRREGKWW